MVGVRTVQGGGPAPAPDLSAAACPIAVAVHSVDGSPADGVLAHLRDSPDVWLLPAGPRPDADVVLVLTSLVTDGVLAEMAGISARAVNPAQSMVLVSGPLRDRHLARAFGCGVVSILPRGQATPRLITRAVVASGTGGAVLPETITRWLVDESRVFQHDMRDAHGVTPGGLTVREVEVLRMLADGQDTVQIAERLSYSERTIKKVIQDVMTRLDLRNRAHAVSYALRAGVI